MASIFRHHTMTIACCAILFGMPAAAQELAPRPRIVTDDTPASLSASALDSRFVTPLEAARWSAYLLNRKPVAVSGEKGIAPSLSDLQTLQILYEDPEFGAPTELGNVVLLSWNEDGSQDVVEVLVDGQLLGTIAGLTTPGTNGVPVTDVPVSCIPESPDDPLCPSKAFRFEVRTPGGESLEQFQEVHRTWPLANGAIFCARTELGDAGCDDVVDFASRTCVREDTDVVCGIIIGGGNDGPSASGLSVAVDGESVLSVEDPIQVKCLEESIELETRGEHEITAFGFLDRDKALTTRWTDPESGITHENIIGEFSGLDGGTALGFEPIIFTTVTTECGRPKPPRALILRQAAYGSDASNELRASWINGESPYAVGVQLFLNGEPFAELQDGGTNNFVFSDLGATLQVVGVQGDSAVVEGPSTITSSEMTLLDAAPVEGFSPVNMTCAWSPQNGGTTLIEFESVGGRFAVDVHARFPGAPDFVYLGLAAGVPPQIVITGVPEGTTYRLQFLAASDGRVFGIDLAQPLYGLEPIEVCGGHRFPGDINEDGGVDISDPVGLLGHLFSGDPDTVPCDGGTIEDLGNLLLLDWSGDNTVDISDAIFALNHLFVGTEGHAVGAVDRCTRIVGCADQCQP